MNRQIQAYGTQQVMTSDPVTLVAMLYDKAVRSLRAAIEAIHDNRIEVRWRNNKNAGEIIAHLLMTLDLKQGGEIAQNLESLYAYMLRRLLDVDLHNDAGAAEEVIQLLEPLRESWHTLAKANRGASRNAGIPLNLAAPPAGKQAGGPKGEAEPVNAPRSGEAQAAPGSPKSPAVSLSA